MVSLAGAPSTGFVARVGAAQLVGADSLFQRVDTDSRTAGPGTLFCCLRGERTDGHLYIDQAYAQGCRSFLVSMQWLAGHEAALRHDCSLVVAADPLVCLQAAARAWREHCQLHAQKAGHGQVRIGITGSSGKTTVKELVASIMQAWLPSVKNPGNLNSDIGLAASLFLLRPEHQVAVFELGINRPGEMALLADIYRPDCALITNIGTAHIGVLGGSRQAIASEKKQICSYFDGPQSLLVWEEDDFRDFLLREINGRTGSFGPRSLPGLQAAVSLGLDGWELDYEGRKLRVALPGAHNLLNCLAAIGLARQLGVPMDCLKSGLEAFSALSGRSELRRGRGLTIINDCYNANPDSVLKAIAMSDDLDHEGRRVLVLGSMKELGAFSDEAHAQVGRAAALSGAVCVAFFGEETRLSWQTALETEGRLVADSNLAPGQRKTFLFSTDLSELEQLVRAELQPGDLVLIKGSRAMALERLADSLLTGEDDDVS